MLFVDNHSRHWNQRNQTGKGPKTLDRMEANIWREAEKSFKAFMSNNVAYSCEYCHIPFQTPQFLFRHIGTVHKVTRHKYEQDNPNYVHFQSETACKICSKSYTRLRDHLDSHHGKIKTEVYFMRHVFHDVGSSIKLVDTFMETGYIENDKPKVSEDMEIVCDNEPEMSQSEENNNELTRESDKAFVTNLISVKKESINDISDLTGVDTNASSDNKDNVKQTTLAENSLEDRDTLDMYNIESEPIKEENDKDRKSKQCKYCLNIFQSRGALTKHVWLQHEGKTLLWCQYCHGSFTSKSNLTAHVRIHTGERPHKCDHCKKTFTRRTTLKNHIRNKKCDKLENVELWKSMKDTSIPQEIEQSRSKETIYDQVLESNQEETAMNLCEKQVGTASAPISENVDAWVRFENMNPASPTQADQERANSKETADDPATTSDKTSFIEEFDMDSDPLSHLKWADDTEASKSMERKEPDNQFSKSRAKHEDERKLNKNVESIQIKEMAHKNKKLRQCKYCGNSFLGRVALTKHIWLQHKGKDLLWCQHCSQSYTTKSDLRVHIRTHTGERPFGCDQCKMSFARRSILNSHAKTHSGERPYPCPFCDMAFRRTQHLRDHVWSHSKKEWLSCVQCNKPLDTFDHVKQFVLGMCLPKDT